MTAGYQLLAAMHCVLAAGALQECKASVKLVNGANLGCR